MVRQKDLNWLSEGMDVFTFGIEYYDSRGSLQYVNKTCLDIFGLSSAGEALGFKLFEDPNLPDEAKEKLLQGKPVNYGRFFDFEKVKSQQLYETTKSGKIYIDVMITPLRTANNDISGYLVQVQDLTARKKAEDTADFLHSLLNHDFANKMTAIQGYLSLLGQASLPRKHEKLVNMAMRGCVSGLALVHKISSLRKIDRVPLDQTVKVDLASVMEVVIDTHAGRAADAGLEIVFETRTEKLEVQGGVLLEELFSNLVENAIIHSGGSLVRITAEKKDGQVAVFLEDNGKGISVTSRSKLFTRGFKRTGSEGSGLGLFLAKTIAELYGGTIAVKGSPLGGARFEVFLIKSDPVA
ncbi:MAG: ATP-binding protein [Candidatus Odinarchaeota archaeon]